MIEIDNEFRDLLKKLSETEYSGLEESIKSEGCHDPLKLWNGVLIDGHNRYNICKKHNIEFKTTDLDFNSKDDAKLWILHNQFHRRNLTDFAKVELALEIEAIISEKAKANLKVYHGNQYESAPCQNSDKQQNTIDTKKEVAKIAGVSHDTVSRVKKIKQLSTPETVEKLRTGEISVNKAYTSVKKEENEKLRIEKTESKELPKEIYQVIYCDPPWQYSNSGLGGSAEKHYSTMDIESLKALEVGKIADENSVMFMWATNPLLTDAFDLLKSWGFVYKTNMVWVKEKKNYGKLGFYIYGQHELLLIATKGKMRPTGEKPVSLITGINNKHSKKPACVYSIIEDMYPNLKYVELFARNKREDWESWGNEV